MFKDIENRNYMIIGVSEIDSIDFSKVMQTSKDTLRFSVDETKTIIKWEGSIHPKFIDDINIKFGPYSHSEMLKIIKTKEWT